MVIFDAHCDTIQRINDCGGNIIKNDYCVDLIDIQSLNSGFVQFFAAFVDKKRDFISPYLRCNKLIECYYKCIEDSKGMLVHCLNTIDIENALAENKVSTLLSIEGGEALEGNLENVHYFYNRGVRAITLTWNYSNEICDGIAEEKGGGVTKFGKSVIGEMNKLGMIIDVSHISVKGFWDVIELSNYPVVATHSNTKKICNNKRNLDDEQIKSLIKNNGCIGINLYSDFLTDGKCEIKDVIRHIEHILSLGGENNIGLGCDFDGADSFPEGIDGVRDLHKLFDEMRRIGYTDLLINKIASDNFLNLMKKILL